MERGAHGDGDGDAAQLMAATVRPSMGADGQLSGLVLMGVASLSGEVGAGDAESSLTIHQRGVVLRQGVGQQPRVLPWDRITGWRVDAWDEGGGAVISYTTNRSTYRFGVPGADVELLGRQIHEVSASHTQPATGPAAPALAPAPVRPPRGRLVPDPAPAAGGAAPRALGDPAIGGPAAPAGRSAPAPPDQPSPRPPAPAPQSVPPPPSVSPAQPTAGAPLPAPTTPAVTSQPGATPEPAPPPAVTPQPAPSPAVTPQPAPSPAPASPPAPAANPPVVAHPPAPPFDPFTPAGTTSPAPAGRSTTPAPADPDPFGGLGQPAPSLPTSRAAVAVQDRPADPGPAAAEPAARAAAPRAFDRLKPALVVLLVVVIAVAVTLVLLQSAGVVHIPLLGGNGSQEGALSVRWARQHLAVDPASW